MYWLILRIVSKLMRKAVRFREQASHPDSPGGTTIIREEWLAFVPEVIEVFAEVLGMGQADTAALFMEGSGNMLDATVRLPRPDIKTASTSNQFTYKDARNKIVLE